MIQQRKSQALLDRAPVRSSVGRSSEARGPGASKRAATGDATWPPNLRLSLAVDEICTRHYPVGGVPIALAACAGIVVAGALAHATAWYAAVAWSLVSFAFTWVSLMLFRLGAWSRRHPLLSALYRARYGRGTELAGAELRGLHEAVIKRYLPPIEWEPLLREAGNPTAWEDAAHRDDRPSEGGDGARLAPPR